MRRGGVHADIPGLHDRIEQTKSKDCHCHRENGEKGSQSLPERISYDEFKERHILRRSGKLLLPAPCSLLLFHIPYPDLSIRLALQDFGQFGKIRTVVI